MSLKGLGLSPGGLGVGAEYLEPPDLVEAELPFQHPGETKGKNDLNTSGRGLSMPTANSPSPTRELGGLTIGLAALQAEQQQEQQQTGPEQTGLSLPPPADTNTDKQ